MELQKGDWVYSYTSGIWQVYRILRYIGIDHATGLERERITVFSKRFVLNSFKRSFTQESCHPDFVDKLDEEEVNELLDFVEVNPTLYAKFCEYEPKSINSIYNAKFGIQEGSSPSDIEKILTTDRVFSELEIGQYLQDAGLDTKESLSWTAQFVSANHLCEHGHLVYRFSRVLDF